MCGLLRFCLIFLVGLVLAACPAAIDQSSLAPGYPAEIADVGDSPSFPLRVGDFRRDQIIAYAPDFADYSIEYNLYQPGRQVASTVYLTSVEFFDTGGEDVEEWYFAQSRQAIEQAHRSAELLMQSQTSVMQNGVLIEGLRATYRFRSTFAGREQDVMSELYVFRREDRLIKFRHTYPAEFSGAVAPDLAFLMETLDWADADYVPEAGESL